MDDDPVSDDLAGGSAADFDRALLADLDELATISSVEAFYAAELPALHRLALRVTDHPNDRTGRYAAVRDAISHAIESMEDQSFADAAQALLGYADRWRSVQARSTDAGRAFTPSVSYDSFRRRSGRNYRGNTLRLLADALKQLETPDAATPAEIAVAAQAPTPAGPTRPGPAAHMEGAPSGPNRLLLLAAALVLLATAAFGVTQRGGDQNEPALETAVAAARTTPTVAPTAALPTAASLQPVAQPVTQTVRGELDVTRHCFLSAPDGMPLFGEQTADGWTCRSSDNSQQFPPDLPAACREQYGPNATAVPQEGSTVGWNCELPILRLNNNTSSSCVVAPGAYDQGSIVTLGRYANRFAAEWEQNVPADVCPVEPLHLYGDGVTQRLAHDGKEFGAILATDPQNVQVLTGSAWLEYESVRGLTLDVVPVPIVSGRIGYPSSAARQDQTYWRIDLTDQSALISDALDGTYFWMPRVALELWMAQDGPDGCLGMPIQTPTLDPPGQKFEHAAVTFNTATGGLEYSPSDACF